MAKKRQTPRPPVQAPRRRESPRPGVPLPQRGRPLIAAGFLAVVVVVVVVAFAVTRSGSASSLPLEPVSAVGPVTTPPAAG